MTAAHDSNRDAEGCCPHHSSIQLRFRSPGTGVWTTLLDSCPLCSANDRSGDAAASVGIPVPRGRERTRSPADRRTALRGRSVSGRSVSRVRFPAEGQLVRRRSISQPPAERKVAPAALKAPKYKECPVEMRRQLDENEKQQVTYMSYDINLQESEIWNSGEGAEAEDGRPVARGDHHDEDEAENELSRMLSLDHEEEQQRLDKELTRKMEEKVKNSITMQTSRMQAMLPEEYELEERSAGSGRSGGSGGGGRRAGQTTRQQGNAQQRPPSKDSASSDASGRGRSGPTQGGAPSRRGRSLQQARVAPDPQGFPCNGHGPRTPSQDSQRSAPHRRPPPPPPRPLSQPPPTTARMPLQAASPDRTGMVFTPSGADEVSLLSSMGGSVATASAATGSSNNSRGVRYQPDQEVMEEDPREDEEEDDDEDDHGEGEESDPAATLVNTANYDSKGRCVHHPHVRLRKKKMFGKWKTKMSACPECCLDALRKMQAADEKKKLAKKKLEQTSTSVHGAASVVGGASTGTAPGSRPRSASVPPQTTPPVHRRGSSSQESSRLAPAPSKARGRRTPSQDSHRSAPTHLRSPSQDSFRSGSVASGTSGNSRRSLPPQPKKGLPVPSDESTSTASLTESDQGNAPALVPKKKTRSKSSGDGGRSYQSGKGPQPRPGAPERELPQPGTIHVSKMQWTDAKGNSGSYTGQVNAQFSPYGLGSMSYDASGKIKEGMWRNGKYRSSKEADGGRQSRSRARSTSQASARQRSASRQSRPGT